MNYQKVYDAIIEKRKAETPTGYTERHHILPRSLGGLDDNSNLVALTAREHFVCHLLLGYIHKNDRVNFHKMVKAAMMMATACSDNQERKYSCNSRIYEKLRIEHSEAMRESQSGSGNSNYGTKWAYNEVERKSKKIRQDDKLEENWQYGRKINFDYLDKREEQKLLKQKELDSNILLYTYYYKLYNMYGYDAFVLLTNYQHSKPNLVQRFKKYVVGFEPQNGKKRGQPNKNAG